MICALLSRFVLLFRGELVFVLLPDVVWKNEDGDDDVDESGDADDEEILKKIQIFKIILLKQKKTLIL